MPLFRTHVYCIIHVLKKKMDVFFYLDQLGRLKFRLFHMLLEICKCIRDFGVF